MIIYLYGLDSYRRAQKLRELVARYRAKHATADFLDIDLGDDASGWGTVWDFLEQPSLFVSVKLAVVRVSGAVSEARGCTKAEVKQWKELLRGSVEDKNVFIIISDSSAPRKAFSFLREDPVVSQEFPVLEGGKLDAFLAREMRMRDCVFSPEARRFFVSYLGQFKEERGWIAVHALEQISLAGFSSPVSLDDLRKVVLWESYDESFRLALDFLQQRTAPRRLFYLESLFLRGDSPRYVLNMISACARGRDDVLALADIDEQVKSGALDDEAGLLAFALGTD